MNRFCRRLLTGAVVSFICSVVLGAATLTTGSTKTLIGVVSPDPVVISNVSNLYSFQFDVSYNPAFLQLTSVTEGSFLGLAGPTLFIPGTIDNQAGIAQFTADTIVGPSPGASGSGTLALLQFKGLQLGTSQVQISNVTLLDAGLNDVAVTVTNSQLTVVIPEPGSCLMAALILVPWLLRRLRPRRTSRGYSSAPPAPPSSLTPQF